MQTGQIRKALSGFYYIYSEGQIYQTRGRGNFRVRNIEPLVGDVVDFESENDEEGIILSVHERKNELVRPPVANVDVGVIVMSAVEPDFSTYLLDRFIVYLEAHAIEPIIFVTKMDLADEKAAGQIMEWITEYQRLGYQAIPSFTPDQETAIQELMTAVGKDRIAVFMGQSGAGKSTLLNDVVPELELETGIISTSLGRGKHTTRHTELHEVHASLIADTPGFSSVELEAVEEKELPWLFPEFVAHHDECRFSGCMHLQEPHCKIKELVNQKQIPAYRYEHYLQFLDEIQKRKPDYSKNKK